MTILLHLHKTYIETGPWFAVRKFRFYVKFDIYFTPQVGGKKVGGWSEQNDQLVYIWQDLEKVKFS